MEIRRVDPDYGQIRIRIVTHEARGEGLPVRQRHLGLAGAMHHMAVGYHVTIRGDHKPRSPAFALTSCPIVRPVTQDPQVDNRVARLFHHPCHRL